MILDMFDIECSNIHKDMIKTANMTGALIRKVFSPSKL
jgi:hypothetical protein